MIIFISSSENCSYHLLCLWTWMTHWIHCDTLPPPGLAKYRITYNLKSYAPISQHDASSQPLDKRSSTYYTGINYRFIFSISIRNNATVIWFKYAQNNNEQRTKDKRTPLWLRNISGVKTTLQFVSAFPWTAFQFYQTPTLVLDTVQMSNWLHFIRLLRVILKKKHLLPSFTTLNVTIMGYVHARLYLLYSFFFFFFQPYICKTKQKPRNKHHSCSRYFTGWRALPAPGWINIQLWDYLFTAFETTCPL